MLEFNFDIILVMIFITFGAIGLLSGLKSQIPISLNIIVPFVVLFYFGKTITKMLFNYPMFSDTIGGMFGGIAIIGNIRFTILMGIAYIFMYFLIFFFVRVLYSLYKNYSKKRVAKKRGFFNRFLGLGLALVNAYVAIYFILLPLYPMGVVDSDKPLTNAMLNNPPFFSRIGNTTKSAAPVLDTVEKASGFLDILTAKNFDEYFNYISSAQAVTTELEQSFMDNEYQYLSDTSKTVIEIESGKSSADLQINPSGLARALLQDGSTVGSIIFDEIIENEEAAGNINIDELKALGANIKKYKGLIIWYMDELGGDTIPSLENNTDGGSTESPDISTIVQKFKEHYDQIVLDTTDVTLLNQLELAKTAIETYDVFSEWMDCTIDNVNGGVEPTNPNFVCDNINPALVTDYDVGTKSASILAFLLSGDNLSSVMIQYKYDYEADVFSEFINSDNHPTIAEALAKSYELVLAYEADYKPVVESLDPELGFVIRLGIAVAKTKFDLYGQMEETPLFAAFANDLSRICSTEVSAVENSSVSVCREGFKKTTAEVLAKAYLIRDSENNIEVIDEEKMNRILDGMKDGIANTVLTSEFVLEMGHQLAFSSDFEEDSLLVEMYNNGHITRGALQILAADSYNLFDDNFRARVLQISNTTPSPGQ